jgi:Uma2 family endonuclease
MVMRYTRGAKEAAMTATLEKPPPVDSVILPHRFSAEEFRKMYELGLVPRRSQLIQGEIYFMAAMGKPHHDALRILGKLLYRHFLDRFELIQQSPIRTQNTSEPEPDFAVLNLEYPGGVPDAKDVLLAIEISDSTLKFDREQKIPEYARSSIPEVWILNLIERQLEVYRQPSGEKYLQLQIVEAQTPIGPLFAPEATLEWWNALEEMTQP